MTSQSQTCSSRRRRRRREEVGLHLPLQNGLEDQIQMTTLQPVSLVKVAGIGDAGKQRGD